LGGGAASAAISIDGPPSIGVAQGFLYVAGQGAVDMDPSLALQSNGDTYVVSATIRLVGYIPGEDTLAFTNGGGISGAWNSGSGILSLTGVATVAQYQAALRSVTYSNALPDPTTTPRSAEFVVSDGWALSAPVDLPMEITFTAHPPVIGVPAQQTVAEESTLVFSQATSNAIVLGDVYAIGAGDRVTVTATDGTLALGSTAGLTFASTPGPNPQTLTFRGTVADLNAALDGLTFTAAPTFSGAASLQISVNNTAAVASGASLVSNATVAINVTHVNHAPVLSSAGDTTLPPVLETDKNPAAITIAAAITNNGFDPISDVDQNSLQGIAVVGLSAPGGGQWQFRLAAATTWVNLDAVSDTGATLLPGSAQIRFLPALGSDGTASLLYRAWDQTTGIAGDQNASVSVNGGSSAFSVNEVTMTLQVIHVSTPPQLLTDTGLVSDGATSATITTAALQASEARTTSDQLTFTITAAPSAGTLAVNGNPVSVGSQFTQADIDAGRLTYVPGKTAAASDSFTFVVTDSTGASLPPAKFQIQIGSPAPGSSSKTVPPLTALPGSTTPPAPAGGTTPISIGFGSIGTSSSTLSAGDSSAASGLDSSGSTDSQAGSGAGSTASTGGSGSSDRSKQQGGAAAIVTPLINPPVAVPLAHPTARPIIEAAGVSARAERPSAQTLSIPGDTGLQSSRTDGVVLLIPDPSSDGAIGKLANLIRNHDSRGIEVISATFNANSPLWHDLDKLQNNLSGGDRKVRVIAGSATVGTLAMSLGYVYWAIRGGSILSSLISSMPAWKLVDPLPILDQMDSRARRRNAAGEEEDDDETLESMVDRTAKAA